MDLTVRTQSTSTITKIPMTLHEFKERYTELLDFHLNEYFEHDELSFTKKWFTIYSNGCNLLAKRTDSNLTSIEKRGLEALGTKQYYPNLEFSFGRICDFLKQKEQELNTIPHQPKTSKLAEVNANESKIHFSAMNKAMSGLQLALKDDKRAIQQPEANLIDLSSSIDQKPADVPKPCFKPKSIDCITSSNTFCFTNEFDHVSKERVYDYFKTELVDKNYLLLDDLHKYLIMAFQEKKAHTEKLELKGSFSKGIIKNIFYRYYNEVAQDKHGLKNAYCKLLGEYFNGFDTAKIGRNFNK